MSSEANGVQVVGPTYNWPWCDKCNKPVSMVFSRQDIFSGDIIYSVRCHGEEARQYVSNVDIHDVTLIWTT